ncbi:MAG: hypothetical protein FWF12_00665 [Betaproteobacteria bacterium]|nr:hypothetical protein [Betaproteobacteria bacterium]
MQALKNIDGVAAVLGGTPLAQSPLWNMPVDKIVPAQLIAYRAKMTLANQKPQADAVIEYLLQRVANVVGSVSMLDYTEPSDTVITSLDLARGFAKMQRPLPAAILFGLEQGMRIEDVVTLTWPKAKKLLRGGKITGYAKHVLKSQPVHIATDYVFWRQDGKKVFPLFGLEQEVFDTFGKTWGEMLSAYTRLVLVEEVHWQSLLAQVEPD